MSPLSMFAIDLVAVSVMVFGMYFPRHRRKDLIVALLAVNLGVLAAVNALQGVETADTLGLGLFGILSIIRLRSSQVEQQEVGYYFVALSLGVIGGLHVSPAPLAPSLMLAILVAMWVGDHPSLFSRYRHQIMHLDRAYTDENELIAHLEGLLHARVRRINIERVDMVHDTTSVEVRYELLPGADRQADAPAQTLATGARR